jgi:hemerythrin
MLLVWTENLSVKIKELDDDHKKLIKVINELHYAILDGGPSGKVDPVEIEIALHRLENYARVHFVREEKILDDADHADLEGQREAHRRMVATVAEMSERFRESTSPRHASELMTFAYEWLTGHVYIADRKWADELNAKRMAIAPPTQSKSPSPPSISRRLQSDESRRTREANLNNSPISNAR